VVGNLVLSWLDLRETGWEVVDGCIWLWTGIC